jgi:2-aminoadipate transaminase
MHLALAQPQLISLAAGFVDQGSLPAEATAAALEGVLADPVLARVALQYGPTPGYPPLRQHLLEMLRTADRQPDSERGLSIEQVLLTAGSNQMLNLVSEVLLNPGEIVLCGAPCYFVYLGVLANLGAQPIGVAVDSEGMIPAALEARWRQLQQAGETARVKAIYLNNDFENPSSATLSLPRRHEIVELARRWSHELGRPLYVIEDAAYRELRYDGEDLPSLRALDPDGATVITTGTFSKSFSPGIRVGWGILPPSLVKPVCELKGNLDFGSPHFSQALMAKVLELGLFRPHVEKLRTVYRQKLQAMLAALDEFMRPIAGAAWDVPHGGLYVWLRLPEGLDAGQQGPLLARAMERGVLYVPGRLCYAAAGEPPRDNTIRLSFGVQSPANIRRGIELLAHAIQDCLSRA